LDFLGLRLLTPLRPIFFSLFFNYWITSLILGWLSRTLATIELASRELIHSGSLASKSAIYLLMSSPSYLRVSTYFAHSKTTIFMALKGCLFYLIRKPYNKFSSGKSP
jgi:hypothetical protein